MGRIHIYLEEKVEREMREKKIRRKGDISKYIEGLIKKDLKLNNYKEVKDGKRKN